MKRTEGDREGGKRAARRDSIHQTRLVNERSNNRNCASNRLIRVENTRVLLPAINRPDIVIAIFLSSSSSSSSESFRKGLSRPR